MSNLLFPTFPGLDWNVKRTPAFATMTQASANGLTVRVPRHTDPMWQFECSFEFLRDDAAHDELNRLMGFFLARQGSFDSFLLDLSTLTQNSADAAISDLAPITLPVDINYCAPLFRPLGPYSERIYELRPGSARQFVDSTAQGGTPLSEASGQIRIYSAAETASGILNANGISYSGVVAKLNGPLADGHTLKASFSWCYRVIFAPNGGSGGAPHIGSDQVDFQALWYQMYEAQQITMVSVRE